MDSEDTFYKDNEYYREADKIEPFFKIFKLFSINNSEMIKLCIAAMRALCIKTDGYFTRSDALKTLSFMREETAKKVFSMLERYEWIVNNGITYELPDKVRFFGMFVISTLSNEENSYDRLLGVTLAISDIDEEIGNSDEISIANIYTLIGALNKVKLDLKKVLEQKSTELASEALMKSVKVRKQIDNIQKSIRIKNRKRYQYNVTTLVQTICADIINLHQDLLDFIHNDIQANAKSFGEYLSPKQINEFFHKCPVEKLALLMAKNFVSPHQLLLMTTEEMENRGMSYLNRSIENIPVAGPPPIVNIEKRELIINKDVDSKKLYDELIQNYDVSKEIPLKNIVIRDKFGDALYRTGLLIILKEDISSFDENKILEIKNKGEIEVLLDGPLKKITKASVSIKRKDGLEVDY